MAVKKHLRHPDSAMFAQLRAVKVKDGSLVVCGLVNAENDSDGYTGFYPFMVGKGPPMIAASEVTTVLVLTVCRAADIELRR
jgi:hypothetical protein